MLEQEKRNKTSTMKPVKSKPAKITIKAMKDMLNNGTSQNELWKMLNDQDGSLDPKEEENYRKAVRALDGE